MTDWSQVLSDTNDPMEADARMQVDFLKDTQNLARSGDWGTLEGILLSVDPEQLSELTILIVLRGMFGFRERLPTWVDLRDRSAQVLTSRGIDVDRSFRGLFQTPPAPVP